MILSALILVILATSFAAVASSVPIPADAFPGVELDPPLEDGYESGGAIPLNGVVVDAAMADGQILFNFVPQSGGADVQLFLSLAGTRFRGYQIFHHAQAGLYDLQVFLGAAGASGLDFVGGFDGIDIRPGSGLILLPEDFFRGIELGHALPTAFVTGSEFQLTGRVADEMADGHLLFRYSPVGGGDAVRHDIPLRGREFSTPQLFFHDQAGHYELEVFVGGAEAATLDFVGGYSVVVEAGEGTINIPAGYFAGVQLNRPLPSEMIVGVPVDFAGVVEDYVRAFRIELESAAGQRTIRVGVDDGRFYVPLRLLSDEAGAVAFTIVIEQIDGQYIQSRSFPVVALFPAGLPRLEVGVLAVALLPDEATAIPITNTGMASLDQLDWIVDGPFEVTFAPSLLAPGENGEILVVYSGTGDDQGSVTILSDDLFSPRQSVSLYGLPAARRPLSLSNAIAGPDGGLQVTLDLDTDDQVLVLYSTQRYPHGDAGYSYVLGEGGAEAKRASPAGIHAQTAVDRVETALRRRERALATTLRASTHRPGLKSLKAAAAADVGDRRDFNFSGLTGEATETVSATAVATNDLAVAWLHDDLRPSADNVDELQIQEIIDQFAAEDFEVTVDAFGAASDVDGDGRVGFLFTHLVDDIGIGGFYAASSVLAESAGGDGNMSDLMFISPTQRAYRSLLVHELQHLINFNQHVLVRGGEGEVSWLNEGLSHVAEDLVSGHAESGVAEIVRAYIQAPGAAGLHGDAHLNPHKRGAAYLFVRSLVDRMGPEVLLRLVGTGLFDWDNVEQATGEEMAPLIASWGSQVVLSGLELYDHPRMNYVFGQLQTAVGRGFGLPVMGRYVGGGSLHGSVPPRGVDFVRVTGSGTATIALAADPEGEVGVVLVPYARDRVAAFWMPPDYLPGLFFRTPMPGSPVQGRTYSVAGEVQGDTIGELLFQFAGTDTLTFQPTVANGLFSLDFRFDEVNSYDLDAFVRPDSDADWTFIGKFGPIQVVSEREITAVAEETDGQQPRKFRLGAAFPNPFNGRSLLPAYAPEGGGTVEVAIYNMLGQRVRKIHRGRLPVGWSNLTWDGTDDDGRSASSGVYVYQIRGVDFELARDVTLVR